MKIFAMKKEFRRESEEEGENNEIQDLFVYRAEAHNFSFHNIWKYCITKAEHFFIHCTDFIV